LCIRLFVIAALVNWRPVFRTSVIKELEKQSGRDILDSLIDKAIVYQEARVNKIDISKAEIENEISVINELLKKQNLSLDEALTYRGQTKEELKEEIKLQKIIEKILADKITITEEEIGKFFSNNKTLFAKGAQLEDVKETIKQQLSQQKLGVEYKKWIDELRAKAKIFYFVKY
jgi:foldase protein PrsA